MKFSTSPVRGTVDYLPVETEVRDWAEQIILSTYKSNGFLHIKTPILESLDLLTNGDSGDNQKLMFKTVKRGASLDLTKENLTEADITEEGLRYDLTVPLVRFFANNREKLTFPFKAIQIDEAFRAERPQKGRVRQFTQCDMDILGDSSSIAEIELLLSAAEAYKKLGFNSIVFKVNDRRILNELITLSGFASDDISKVLISLDKFDKIGVNGVKDELVQKGFENTMVNKLIDMFSKIQTSFEEKRSVYDTLLSCGVSDTAVSSVRLIIESVRDKLPQGFGIIYDASIIRGQGYYTGTVFEAFDESFGRALGGGGRYDNMIGKFLNENIPAVGFSIGFYSTVMLILERNLNISNEKLALVYAKDENIISILSAKQKLKALGYQVATFAFPKNFNEFTRRLKACGYNKLVKTSDLEKIIEI